MRKWPKPGMLASPVISVQREAALQTVDLSEAVLYTTVAAVHVHRQVLVTEPRVESTAEVEAVPCCGSQYQCVWQTISCGAWAKVHVCAEVDRQTSETRFRLVVWVLETGAVIVNDILSVGCRWWQSAGDDKAFRRLTGVDGLTYGLQFRSATKASECSRIVDHVLSNPGVLKVVRKLMRGDVDLKCLVMAWQGLGLHSIPYPSSSPSSPPSSTLRAGQQTLYPKQDEMRPSWREQEQQQEGAISESAKNAEAFPGPEVESSVDDEEGGNQQEDQYNGVAASPVALLEIGGGENLELRLATSTRSGGDWISRPYKTRGEIHVTYDQHHARYEGLPDEWRTINLQFGLPLEQVPKREVEGYETKLPAVLERMKVCFLSHNGAHTEGVFRLAPDQRECNQVKAAINNGSFEDCSDVHIMASLIKVWFRELPVSLFDTLEQQIPLTCELVDPEPEVVLQSLSALPLLHQTVALWLLDLLNEVVKNAGENKMTAKSLAIVIAPNLLNVKDLDAAVVATKYRQVADFVEMLLRARLSTSGQEE